MFQRCDRMSAIDMNFHRNTSNFLLKFEPQSIILGLGLPSVQDTIMVRLNGLVNDPIEHLVSPRKWIVSFSLWWQWEWEEWETGGLGVAFPFPAELEIMADSHVSLYVLEFFHLHTTYGSNDNTHSAKWDCRGAALREFIFKGGEPGSTNFISWLPLPNDFWVQLGDAFGVFVSLSGSQIFCAWGRVP